MGHASITTTLNVYGHLWPSLGAQLDDRIEAVHQEAQAAIRRNGACLGTANRSEGPPTTEAEEESGL
ncbi:MAG: hypothetical protein ACRDJU_05375 [Actinomycetota bacterium]